MSPPVACRTVVTKKMTERVGRDGSHCLFAWSCLHSSYNNVPASLGGNRLDLALAAVVVTGEGRQGGQLLAGARIQIPA